MKYKLKYVIDGKPTKSMTLRDPDDVLQEMICQFASTEFAYEMMQWANDARPGDHFEDEDIIIDVVA